MSNFGEVDRLTVDGVPMGRHIQLPADEPVPGRKGSCIVVVGTDAPIDHAGCERLARRAGMGLSRVGSTAHHGSGEIFMAFANGRRTSRGQSSAVPAISGSDLDDFFAAVIDATEEAVLSSMLQATTVRGRDGNTLHALPVGEVKSMLRRFARYD